MEKEIGIYIHIPFCASKCYYCDFNSYANKENMISSYIEALCMEILSKADVLSEHIIKTIYIGGGTPSFTSSSYITRIIDTLRLFNIKEDAEITIEANPNSLNLEKLKEYSKAGINRLSIGLQSTHDDVLKAIGRKHTRADFIKALENAKLADICNISCDLMYPLPNLSYESFKESVCDVINLSKIYDIKHISVYNLEVHEGTKLDFLIKEGFVALADEDEEYKMREYLNLKLKENGFDKYEISNFAKAGFESKHNLGYWNQDYYLGFGAGASSFFGGSRYTNEKSVEGYINGVLNNSLKIEDREDMDLLALIKEYVILRLRLKEGVIFKDFEKRFNKPISSYFDSEINDLKNKGLLGVTEKNIYLTDRGQEVANQVWEMFI